MSYPEPALGSSQIKVLKDLKAAGGYVPMDEDRALEKLWKKGYVRWQAVGKGREYAITRSGLDALERKTS